MVKKQKRLRIILIISLIIISCIGSSLFFFLALSSNKLIKIMVNLNSYIDQSVYFAYHLGFSHTEYNYFLEQLDLFFHSEHLIDILESSGIYDIKRLERFRSFENANAALVELKMIQLVLGDFLLGYRKFSILIFVLSTALLTVHTRFIEVHFGRIFWIPWKKNETLSPSSCMTIWLRSWL
ncbi:MAG: hypothetical protein B6241_11545 [Spirochaetaceae bacterium 4572_59]|nr:MAG: hypothetical protein B6241_11545 [Spirochaetaceae bacterium 4572_59]